MPSSSRPQAATSARSVLSTKSKRPLKRPVKQSLKRTTAAPKKKSAARPGARKPAAARPARAASKTTRKAPAAARRKKAASQDSRASGLSKLTPLEKDATREEMERYADAGMSLTPDELRWWVGLEALVIGGRTGIERLSRATRYSTSDIRAIIQELQAVVEKEGDTVAFEASLRQARELRNNHRKRRASLN